MNIVTRTSATRVNPKTLLAYGLPKIGKTTAFSKLEDSVIVDLNDETAMLDNVVVYPIEGNSNLQKLASLQNFIKEAIEHKQTTNEYVKKYIIIDNTTVLSILLEDAALATFKRNAPDKQEIKDELSSIFDLAHGRGEKFYREEWYRYMSLLESCCETVIFIGHVKDKMLSESLGESVTVTDIDLRGKLSSIIPSKCDATAYMYRDITNRLIFSFKANKNSVGSRCKHLRNTEIVISDSEDSFNFDKLFI